MPYSTPSHKSLRTMLALCLTLFAFPAFAYIGPGAGLTAIGSFIALSLAVLIAIIGFLWFPIKRMLKKKKASQEAANQEDA